VTCAVQIVTLHFFANFAIFQEGHGLDSTRPVVVYLKTLKLPHE
jgi:hypothetical protein